MTTRLTPRQTIDCALESIPQEDQLRLFEAIAAFCRVDIRDPTGELVFPNGLPQEGVQAVMLVYLIAALHDAGVTKTEARGMLNAILDEEWSTPNTAGRRAARGH